MVIGPLGWNLLAARVGFDAPPVVPLLAVVGAALGAIALANVIALWPGIGAGRGDPGVALRTE